MLFCDGSPVKWTTWTGRHAISIPGATIKEIYATLDKETQVVHELNELHEKLGVLVITIVKDADGYETCLVSSECFDPSTKEAADWKGPDFDLRRKNIDERAKKSDKGRSS